MAEHVVHADQFFVDRNSAILQIALSRKKLLVARTELALLRSDLLKLRLDRLRL